ncbi:MAG: hypothetical protein K8E66_14355, partial [Phycisphaerales bacterium]|nr:hypothetical protein [Phycisphaerales bacterium]
AVQFTAEWAEVPEWRGHDTGSRERVASLARLAPPPPELNVGDRFPSVALTESRGDTLSARLWRPLDVFESQAGYPGSRPAALILALVRPNAEAAEWLQRTRDRLKSAHALINGGNGRIYALSCPVVATTSTAVSLDHLKTLREAWTGGWVDFGGGPYPPEMTWCPASLLLDRVAPGADAAIVVIDRSGWIVGVHGEDATPEEIAESIRAAAR